MLPKRTVKSEVGKIQNALQLQALGQQVSLYPEGTPLLTALPIKVETTRHFSRLSVLSKTRIEPLLNDE